MEFSDAFELGTTLEFVRISDDSRPEVKGEDWLIDMLSYLQACLYIAEIEDEMVFDDIEKWKSRLSKSYRKGQKISKQDGEELSRAAENWTNVIYKELCARPCVEFQKGALNQKALMVTSEGKASDIFDKKVWNNLPKIAQNDFFEAAKCLLIGASTAATMVALRGTEAVIRSYYAQKTKKPSAKVLGKILDELGSLPQVNKKLLGYLDYIRSEKRNMAQHPTKTFNQREAERIFMEIVSATHDIYAEMP